MDIITSVFAKAFVTTYGIGNEYGFATGKWFDLTEFNDKEEFLAEATSYAQNVLGDNDPELCFSDYELSFDIDGLISESGVSRLVWDLLELDADELAIIEAYIGGFGIDSLEDIEEIKSQANERYRGQYDDDVELAFELLSDDGTLESLPCVIENALDWEYLGEYYAQNYISHNGYYFWSHV